MCHNIYISISIHTHTHTHTHSRADLTVYFLVVAWEPLSANASTATAAARQRARAHTHTQPSHSRLTHRSLTTNLCTPLSISITRTNTQTSGFAALSSSWLLFFVVFFLFPPPLLRPRKEAEALFSLQILLSLPRLGSNRVVADAVCLRRWRVVVVVVGAGRIVAQLCITSRRVRFAFHDVSARQDRLLRESPERKNNEKAHTGRRREEEAGRSGAHFPSLLWWLLYPPSTPTRFMVLWAKIVFRCQSV